MEADQEERTRAFPTRRLIRWAAILTAVILAVLACWQDPLYAI